MQAVWLLMITCGLLFRAASQRRGYRGGCHGKLWRRVGWRWWWGFDQIWTCWCLLRKRITRLVDQTFTQIIHPSACRFPCPLYRYLLPRRSISSGPWSDHSGSIFNKALPAAGPLPHPRPTFISIIITWASSQPPHHNLPEPLTRIQSVPSPTVNLADINNNVRANEMRKITFGHMKESGRP